MCLDILTDTTEILSLRRAKYSHIETLSSTSPLHYTKRVHNPKDEIRHYSFVSCIKPTLLSISSRLRCLSPTSSSQLADSFLFFPTRTGVLQH
jgi:hypothetical protein